MIRTHLKVAFQVTLAAALVAAPALAQDSGKKDEGEGPQPAAKSEKEIVLAGGGGFDYVHAYEGRLYVAHGGTIDVVDIAKGERVGQVEGVEGAHGTAIAPEAKLGFATAGRKKKLLAFDLETLKVKKEIETGEGPDAVLFVSSLNEVWSINHRAGSVTCVDVKTLEVTKTIEVGGKLEFAVEDAAKGLVFVNSEDTHEVVAIDAKKHEVAGRFGLSPAAEPTGLAIDVASGLLFAGCGSGKLVVLDESGKIIESHDIGEHCDAVAYDAEAGLVFASCGSGVTNVFHFTKGKGLEALKPIETAKGGKTCAVDPKNHKLYVAVGPRRGEKGEAKLLVYPYPETAAKKAD